MNRTSSFHPTYIPDTVLAARHLYIVLLAIALSDLILYGTVVPQRVSIPEMGIELRDAISTA
ncbi:hypothetical protein P3T23_007756 [Paraburkholderia sp. GAS448]